MSFRDNALRFYWIASLCALAFAYGVAVGVFRVFPYRQLQDMAFTGRELLQYPRHTLRLFPEKFLAVSPPAGRGVTRHVAGATSPGMTLITGFFDGDHRIRLIDLEGRLLNEWQISFNEIWPEAPHLDDQPHDWDTEIHGAMLFPNGDVVFTFQYGGLVRMDRCSRVRWKLPRRTHHQFAVDAEGGLWVPSRQRRKDAVAKFTKVPAPFEEEQVLHVSSDGSVLREISILDAVYDSGLEGLLFASGTHDTQLNVPLSGDFMHLNDVDILSAELAPAFQTFEQGDLLVSLRNLNLLMVISADTGRIRWTGAGPFLRQHDPDFLASGRISLFDNRRDDGGNRRFGGSRVIEIDPASGTVTSLYGSRKGEDFYTETMGDQQLLANGNLLISESNKGHAFEVGQDGNIVWSYVNTWTDGSVGGIAQATRYPDDYLSQSPKEPCHESPSA